MLRELRPAVVLLGLFTVLTGLLYPLAITGVAQLVAPSLANGSLVIRDGKVVGSSLIGQAFVSDRYFHGRPSATTGTDPNDASKTIDAPYNAANSAGSNLGPTSAKLLARVQADVATWRKDGGEAAVPADAVTASASGLDPDISPANALSQAGRVAGARGLPDAEVRALVQASVARPFLGVIGEPRVNVLVLNLAMDRLQQTSPPAATQGAIEPK
jgi:K+-transporting ATPase ATPase C chain